MHCNLLLVYLCNHFINPKNKNGYNMLSRYPYPQYSVCKYVQFLITHSLNEIVRQHTGSCLNNFQSLYVIIDFTYYMHYTICITCNNKRYFL